jgi:REP element-mobilizing transposase RayT
MLNYIAQQMKKTSQLDLIPAETLKTLKSRTFGGSSLKKRRKVARPLKEGLIHHVVFKSSKAQGPLSFYTHKHLVHSLLKQKTKKFFVEVLDFVNMGNHLHLKMRFQDKKRFQQFLKSFSALVARKITGAKKGFKFGRFWDGLVYTRIILSSFEELGLKGYFEANHRQRELGYKERELFLKRFNEFLYRLKQRRATSTPRFDLIPAPFALNSNQ